MKTKHHNLVQTSIIVLSFFLSINRNKESIESDLFTKKDYDINNVRLKIYKKDNINKHCYPNKLSRNLTYIKAKGLKSKKPKVLWDNIVSIYNR